jgi:putative addiction module component (TIGR02574 family)
MTMSSKQTVIDEVLRLSESERLEVAEAVYQSLEGPRDGAEDAWSAEIQRRLNDIDAGRVKLVPWPQARRQIAGEDDRGRAAG